MNVSPSSKKNGYKRAKEGLSEKELLEVSKKLKGCDWKRLGRNLKLDETELDEVERNNAMDGLAEIKYKMLLNWQSKYGTKATRGVLMNSLENIGLIQVLQDLFQDTTDENSHFRNKECLEALQMFLFQTYSHLELPRECNKNKILFLDELFVDMTMILKNGLRTVEKKSSVPMKKIFVGPHVKRILIEGDPGFGKTTLAMKLLSDWAKGDNYIREKFDLVLYQSLRELDNFIENAIDKNLLEFILLQNKNLSNSEILATLDLTKIKLLLILDDFDALKLSGISGLASLLEGIDYPLATVIVMSRTGEPYYRFPIRNTDQLSKIGARTEISHSLSLWDKRIQIKGITQKNKTVFLRKYLKELNIDNFERYEHLINNESQFFYHSPLVLLLFALLIEEKQFEPFKKRTEFLKKFFNFLVKRSLLKDDEDSCEVNVDIFDEQDVMATAFRLMLCNFGELALNKLMENTLSFTKEEINKHCGSDAKIFQLGFITRRLDYENHELQMRYEVINKPILEFLAAFFIASHFEDRQLHNVLHHEIFYKSNSLLTAFVVGLMKSKAFLFLQSVENKIQVVQLSDISLEMDWTKENIKAFLQFHLWYIFLIFLILVSLELSYFSAVVFACALYFTFWFITNC